MSSFDHTGSHDSLSSDTQKSACQKTQTTVSVFCKFFEQITELNLQSQGFWISGCSPAANYPLAPLTRPSDGAISPDFPKYYFDLAALSEKHLDRLAKFYNQWHCTDPSYNSYPRRIIAPFGDAVFKTQLGDITPLSFSRLREGVSDDKDRFYRAFNDAVYTPEERLAAKQSMFCYFIGVTAYPCSPVVVQRGARFVDEMMLVLMDWKTVESSRPRRFWWKLQEWGLGGDEYHVWGQDQLGGCLAEGKRSSLTG